ncbi:MAG: transglycosylase SLT domain-containing protein [Elusimicrobia bacterium]|nr:transglycosylase SLT domain-containing protein [Elusimicrobiota bacterium]
MLNVLIAGAVLSLRAFASGPEEAPAWIGQGLEAEKGSPEARVQAVPERPRRSDRFDHLIMRHARRNALDPGLVKAIIATESQFTAHCVSPSGALGLMQVMPATGSELGIPEGALLDPEANIRAGTDYLNLLFRAAWRLYGMRGRGFHESPPWLRQRVIAAYHGGPRLLACADWPPKTRDYVGKVLQRLESPVSELRPGSDDAGVYLASKAASQ